MAARRYRGMVAAPSPALAAPALWLAALLLAASAAPLAAQALPPDPQPSAPRAPVPPEALPEELVLEGDNIVTVTVNGVPLRFEVSADTFGTALVNPGVAARLMLLPEARRGWQFGPVSVEGVAAPVLADFGAGPVPLSLSWSERAASARADGVIGVHLLPRKRVTFALHPPAPGETEQRFPMHRAGGRANTRIGTEVTVGKKKLMVIFAAQRAENLVTAPAANFIATHREGGFEPGSEGTAVMNFAVERPTRMMRLAEPILLGDLVIERFAVRIEDYGYPRQVGEIAPGDPRFDRNHILVSRRKGKGRPDLLTRIGRDQIAHCSSITYDFAASEIRLSCAAPPPSEG